MTGVGVASVGRETPAGDLRLRAVPEAQAYQGAFDCAVITTHHRVFDYPRIARSAPVIVDTRNALRGMRGDNIFRL